MTYETGYKGLKFTDPWVTTIKAKGHPTIEQVAFALSAPEEGDNFFVAVARNRTIGNKQWSAFKVLSDLNEIGMGLALNYQMDTETELYICLFRAEPSQNKPVTDVPWKWGDIFNLMQR